MTLFADLVLAKTQEIEIAALLKTQREALADGGREARKQFEATLKRLSKATRNVNRAETIILRSATEQAHKALGISYTMEYEDEADE